MTLSNNRVPLLIIGAGPTGLGAAWRLHELGNRDWRLVEAAPHAGGLATSFVDRLGFTWDVGGHVQFSHYEYFDQAMLTFLGQDGWLHHQRESWVWIRERFVPYPFQNNIHRLPPAELDRCLAGLVDITRQPRPRPENFGEWIDATFGRGIAEVFLRPYNFKVWAYAPEKLSATWTGERVAVTDLARVLHNLVYAKDDLSWGPNQTFQFPRRGGTGAIWQACANRLPADRVHLTTPITRIDLDAHRAHAANGEVFAYDQLISTLPLRELVRLTQQTQLAPLVDAGLLHSSSNIVGIGLRGRPPPQLATKCWMYFPEDNCPFYRVTVFSNYSPHNVPENAPHWSLMAEVSESPDKPVQHERLLEDVIQGALRTRLLERREKIVSTWTFRAGYGYPTPALQRDRVLAELLPFFEARGIYSRGRFGAWKYEVSNQDHSFMQGVEVVERILHNRPEITVADPNHANSQRHPWPFARWRPATES